MGKIVLFSISLRNGGAERVISNLSNDLVKDNQVYIVLMDLDVMYQLDPRVNLIKLAPIGDVRNGLLKFLLIPYYSFYLLKFIKKENIDKIYAFLLRPNLISIVLKFVLKNVKVIISERSNPVAQYATNSISDKVNRFLIRKLYPKADIITVNSYGSSVALKEFYNITQKIEVIKNPINEIFFPACKLTEIKQELFVFITVGRLDEGKNHIILLKSINQLVKKGVYNFKLNIVGSGHLEKFLKQYVDENDLNSYVCFLGQRMDVNVLMKESNCFVFTSKREGFPNVLQEALAVGIPIISTDCPFGPREILTGKNVLPNVEMDTFEVFEHGLLIPLNNIEETARSMEYVMKNINDFNHDTSKILNPYRIHNVIEQFRDIM